MISFNDNRMANAGPPTSSVHHSVIFNDPDRATARGRSSSVATDQNASVTVADSDNAPSVIENELPTYRAISVTAIISLLCGALAVCAFAAPIFYLFSILAVALGI